MSRRSLSAILRIFAVILLLFGTGGTSPVQAQQAEFVLLYPSMTFNAPTAATSLQFFNPSSQLVMMSLTAGTRTASLELPPFSIREVQEADFTGTGSMSAPLVASASGPVEGLALVYRKAPDLQLRSIVPLFKSVAAATRLVFGPVNKNSAVAILNNNPNIATLSMILYSMNGASPIDLGTTAIQANGGASVSLLQKPTVPADFSGTLLVTSDQNILGIMNEMETNPSGTPPYLLKRISPPLLGPTGGGGYLYQMAETQASTALAQANVFMLFQPRAQRSVDEGEGARASRFLITNIGASNADHVESYYTSSGTNILNNNGSTIPPGGSVIIDTEALSTGSSASLVLSSSQPMVMGDLTDFSPAAPGSTSISYQARAGSTLLHLPRLIKNDKTHSLFSVMNVGISPAPITAQVYDANGANVATLNANLLPYGFARWDLRAIAQLPETFSGSAIITSSQPLAATVDELFQSCAPPAVTLTHAPDTITPTTMVTFTANTSGTTPFSFAWTQDGQATGANQNLYEIASLSEGSHTIGVTVTNACGSAQASETVTSAYPCVPATVSLSRQPAGAVYPTDTIQFTATPAGSGPYSYTWKVDGETIGETGANYSAALPVGQHVVTVTVTGPCGTHTATMTVTVVELPCSSPTLTVGQSPAGVIFPTDTIRFTATAGGTAPLSYKWLVDGVEDPSTQPILTKTLPAGDHYVTGEASNRCGTYTYTRAFTVVEPPANKPDLSLSTLNSTSSQAGAGDTITYVAVLRNTGQLSSPGSIFQNDLPSHTTYEPGSARASDGRPVTFDGDTLSWTGELVPGSPVVITYAVKVGSQQVSSKIFNNAMLTDSQNVTTVLHDAIPYKAGYSFQLNDGRIGANNHLVKLTFTYDLSDGITHFQVSNETDFAPGKETSEWLPVTSSPQVLEEWKVKPLGDPRSLRVVHLRFGTPGNAMVGPFTASILLDEQPPGKPEVDDPLSVQAHQFTATAANQWTVTTSDDNTGVEYILIGTSDNPDQMTRIAATGAITTFTWQPSGPGQIFLRAVDRSGNVSEATTQQNTGYFLYLPATRR